MDGWEEQYMWKGKGMQGKRTKMKEGKGRRSVEAEYSMNGKDEHSIIEEKAMETEEESKVLERGRVDGR